MFRKCISLTLIYLLLNLTFYSAAFANIKEDLIFAEKVKSNIQKLGVSADSKVKIKLKDGTKKSGFISEIKDTSFVLTNEKTGKSEEVQYSAVKKAQGGNSKTGQRILVIAIVVGLIAFLAWGAARGN